jgi:hypothetical protein
MKDQAANRFRWMGNVLTWTMAALFLIWGGLWAFRAGMDARREIWQSTRSIRFVLDIRNGFAWGHEVLRYAESEAGLAPMSDALAGQPAAVVERAGRPDLIGKPRKTFRRLTAGELMRGIVHYVDWTARYHADDQDYDLDYPPLRLAIMTLWARQAERSHPGIDGYPMGRAEDTSLPQAEDIAEPMLRLNAYCDAAAAVLIFALVWLWVHRGLAPGAADVPRGAWIVPHGIFAFMIATAGFWYAYATLVHIPPTPAPVVMVNRIQAEPRQAMLSVTVNAQNQDTHWHIDFGPTITYGRRTPTRSADATTVDQSFSVSLQELTSGQMVHFRVSATNSGGTTNSDDFSFVAGNQSIDVSSDPVGGIVWPTWTVWLRLLVLLIVMVASAQLLPPIHRGWACGAVAAMLLWFDPLNLIDSHAWPQWDIWILPVFLAATLLASVNWWTVAGILLGIGCMAKGQLLLAGPMLMLWPLFEGRWGAAVRIVTGFLIGAALVTWPWIVNSAAEMHWIELAMTAAAIVGAAAIVRGPLRQAVSDTWRQWLPAILFIATAAIVVILIFHEIANPGAELGFLLLLVLLPPWFLRRRYLGFWLASVFAATVWIGFSNFGGNDSWLTLGFAYGSVKHDQMQMSLHFFSNLPSILAENYHWNIHDIMGTLRFSFSTPGPWRVGRLIYIPSFAWSWASDLDVKTAMTVLYGICLVIASAAAAIHSRRRDRRFLVALVVPWLVFPMIMCQMGGRYPIWATAISSAMVAVSMELTLLHVVLAVFGFAMVAQQLLSANAQRWPQLNGLMNSTYPDVAWMMLLIAGIVLVAALVPSRKCRGIFATDENQMHTDEMRKSKASVKGQIKTCDADREKSQCAGENALISR